jgi:hypothetical protein
MVLTLERDLDKTAACQNDRFDTFISRSKDNDLEKQLGVEVANNNRIRRNERAQAIFQLLEERYETNVKANKWSKVRRYVYHATSTNKNTDNSNTSRDMKKRSRSRQAPLDSEQTIKVLNCLEKEFFRNDQVCAPFIIQSIPRILRRSVNTQILPTIEFLKQLYQEDLFFVAIQRNPALLLISGIQKNINNDEQAYKINAEFKDETAKSNTSRGYNETRNTHTSLQTFLETLNLGLTRSAIGKIKLTLTQSSIGDNASDEHIEDRIKSMINYLLLSIGNDERTNNEVPSMEESNRRKVIGKMISTNPNILTLNLQSNIIPKVKYLQKIGNGDRDGNDETVNTDAFLFNLFKKCPSIMGFSLHDNIIPSLNMVHYLLHISVDDVLMCCNQNHNIDNVDKLITLPSTTKRKDTLVLKKVLTQHPQMIALSKENLAQKVNFFHSIDLLDYPNAKERNATDAYSQSRTLSLAARIMRSSPSVYSLSLKCNIIPTIECLASLWQVDAPRLEETHIEYKTTIAKSRKSRNRKTRHESLGHKIAEYPLVLTLSLEGNIQPTINFYNRTGYINLTDNGKVNKDSRQRKKERAENEVYLPARYLATSLFSRLLPRWNYYKSKRKNDQIESSFKGSLKNARTNDGSTRTSQSMNPPPLHLIASATDDQFCKHMGFDQNHYSQFKEEAIPRLKFSSQFDTWLKTGKPIDL